MAGDDSKAIRCQERYFDRHIFPIFGAPGPESKAEFFQVPTELPWLDEPYVLNDYLINLDRVILTIAFGAHIKLANIPPHEYLWNLSTYSRLTPGRTTSRKLCKAEHLASPAIDLPEPIPEIGYASRTVAATIDSGDADARNRWLMRVLAEVISVYKRTIHQFGREWAPSSFPFRELAYSLLWIASGKARFLSFPKGLCHGRFCTKDDFGLGKCKLANPDHVFPTGGWYNREWAGDTVPLFEFGSLFHRPGQRPGVSPEEPMYWFDGVLISLVLVVDGAAVTAAVTWGLQERSDFQLVVMSLYEVVLAEVSTSSNADGGGAPFVKVSHPLALSGLRKDEGLSTHPLEHFPLNEAGTKRYWASMFATHPDCTKAHHYPGLAGLVSFFAVSQQRLAAANSNGVLPVEIYWRILDHVDFDTWRACSTVSPAFRSYCLLKSRINDQWRLLPDSVAKPDRANPLFSFKFAPENMHTGKTVRLVDWDKPKTHTCRGLPEYNWMPIIGSDPRALMVLAVLRFDEVVDEAVVDEAAVDKVDVDGET
jgi:hypothetical protein